ARYAAGACGDAHVAVPERGRVDVVRGGAGGLLGDVGGPGLGHDHLAAVHDKDEQRQRHEREDHHPERHRAAVACVPAEAAGQLSGWHRQPRSSKGSSGAAAVSPNVWLTGKPMTWKAARLATQDTVTSMSWATAKSPAPTGAPFSNNWTFMVGAPPLHTPARSACAADCALACASAKVRASEAPRTASRAAEPTLPVRLSHWPPA